MRARGGGVIVNLSSGAAHNPLEGWSAYCAGKAATAMLTRCAHLEMKGHGIRVFGLSPGTVATDMQRRIKASGINPVSQMDFSQHAPAEAPAAEAPAAAPVHYATASQKEEIIRLLNHPLITRQEKTKMLLNINRLDEERATQAIAKLRKAIEDRKGTSAVAA